MLRNPGALALTLGLALAASLCHTRLASAQGQPPPPVDVRVDGIFGNELIIGDGYATVVVVVRNNTRETFRGEVEVSSREWQQSPERHVSSLDLPGLATRRVLFTLFVGASGASVDAVFRVDGGRLGAGSQGVAYAPGGGGVVVLADPPRLRASLLELQATVPGDDPGGYMGTSVGEREVELPVGVVELDAATSDPILPDVALGWARIRTLAVSAPMFSRIQERELRAIEGWIRMGGHVVVFPRSAADLNLPFIRDHFGSVSQSDAPLPVHGLTPGPGVPSRTLSCTEGSMEVFGCARGVGHGAVYLASWDGASPPGVEDPATRALITAVSQRAGESSAMSPILPFGVGRDSFQSDSWRPTATFARLRAALDPNEGYRPALGLVAIVLLLYVFAVGPINFTLVQRRNQPTLALLTTPALAFGCVLVMLGVGYLGKGVMMRYRRLELVEVVQGEHVANGRRYTGLFMTRPSVMDMESPPDGRTMRLSSGGGDDGLVHRDGASPPVLAGVRGGLWETLFMRDDRLVELGGELDFVVDGRRLAAVVNHTQITLRGAFVVDAGGGVYPVGEVAPGATVPIPREASTSIAGGMIIGGVEDPGVASIARLMGLPEDDLGYVLGYLRLTGGLTRPAPVLYALADPDTPPQTSPGFSVESDYRIVALRPRLDLAPLVPSSAVYAPDPQIPLDSPGWGEPEQVDDPTPSDAGGAQESGGAP